MVIRSPAPTVAWIWPSAEMMVSSAAEQFDPDGGFELMMTERLDRACAQMGVMAKTRASGLMIGPPADSEYAVEPVGELTMRPSPR